MCLCFVIYCLFTSRAIWKPFYRIIRILSCTNSKKNGNVFSKADVSVERTDHRWENQCSELTFDHLKRGYHLKGCS